MLKFPKRAYNLEHSSSEITIFVVQFQKGLWHIEDSAFRNSDRVNLDTSQSAVRLLLNQNNGKNALLVCIPYNTKYAQVGFDSPYLFSKGVQALHGG